LRPPADFENADFFMGVVLSRVHHHHAIGHAGRPAGLRTSSD
jgi:hypothetical protein